MTHKILAMGPNGILLAAAILAVAVIFAAFYRQILGTLGVHMPKRRRRIRRLPKTTRMDIISQVEDDA